MQVAFGSDGRYALESEPRPGVDVAALQVFVVGSVVLEEDVVERFELAAAGVEHVEEGTLRSSALLMWMRATQAHGDLPGIDRRLAQVCPRGRGGAA